MSGGNDRRPANGRLAGKLALIAVGMFGFGFALWPLYNVFCDITGLGGRGVKIAESAPGTMQSDRQVRLRFDATVNSNLPWEFEPIDRSVTVTLGEMSEAHYRATNPTGEPLAGHAIFNVTPPEASLYFVKTECFCFTQQVLQAGESRDMPVYYFIQPDLPEHIKELTLSYTFFKDPGAQVAQIATGSGANPATGRNEE
jgi:cytochrome c oxidase assembly protein subunit 11